MFRYKSTNPESTPASFIRLSHSRPLCCCCYLPDKSCLTLSEGMDCSPSGSSVHGISQEEYQHGLPFPSLGGLPDPGIKPMSPALTSGFYTTEISGKP